MVAHDPTSQYFDSNPSTATDPSSVDLVLPDLRITLATDRGVFARDHVDVGTKLLLLEGPPPALTDRVLVDVGAGYGPIACALAKRNPEATVYAVEINARARDLCRANAASAGLDNVVVIGPEEVPSGLQVDRMWSNPPIRIGKSALHELLSAWLDRLGPNDAGAHIVVQRHLGADSLQRWLEGEGWHVQRRKSRKAYRLLDISRPGEQAAS